MHDIRSAWIIYKNHFPAVYQHWSVITSGLLMTIFTVFTHVEKEQYGVFLFSISVLDVSGDPISALQLVFFDYFSIVWAVVCIGFVPVKILVPVVQSYTVSNSLWLRLAPTNIFTLALYRVLLVMIPSLSFGLMTSLWCGVFSLVHGIPYSMIVYPVYSLLAFILFTGSISILMAGRPTTLMEVRYAYVFLALIIPVLFLLLKNKLVYKFDGIFPFVFPYRADKLGFETLPGTITAIVMGVVLILFVLGINYIRILSQKNQKQ